LADIVELLTEAFLLIKRCQTVLGNNRKFGPTIKVERTVQPNDKRHSLIRLAHNVARRI